MSRPSFQYLLDLAGRDSIRLSGLESAELVMIDFPEKRGRTRSYRSLRSDRGTAYVDLWDAYEDDYFGNVDHLNGDGARRLSGDLRRVCKGGGS